MKKITVIISWWNQEALLKNCVETIKACNYERIIASIPNLIHISVMT